MKFRIQATAFQSLLNKVLPATPAKSQLNEILEHILFDVSDGKLIAIGTDNELSIKSSIDVDIAEEGKILVPAKKLNEVIRVINSSEDIEFISDEALNIRINSGKSKFVLKGMEADEYIELPEILNEYKPDIDNLNDRQTFLQKSKIQRLAEKTYFAVSTDEYRLNMSGVLFQFRESYINAVSTDSFRLVRTTEFAGELPYLKDINIIVPVRTVEVLRKVEDDIILSLENEGENMAYLRIDFGETVIVSRLIDASFPKYEAIIPVTSNADANLDISDLLKALKQVAPLAHEKARNCRLNITESEMIISTENDDLGETATCSIPVEFIDKTEEKLYEEGFLISFNIKYLEELLQNITQNDTTDNIVELHLIEPTKAALIKPKAEQDLLTMILMPIRL